jgi:hypothetical protein
MRRSPSQPTRSCPNRNWSVPSQVRRTFTVNTLYHGIAPIIMMKWTGHSDHKTMKPNIDIVDCIRAKEMTKMDFMD